ncbi:sugar ABC transporter substrate-binding protein [Streptomyces sp. NPDC092369]|uniref:sugar ABC transporter substrate-binding protein n=1 Tax=Streptomyces sp. NPDC092369 TaxID=3366015 RepID=UPI0037F33FA4
MTSSRALPILAVSLALSSSVLAACAPASSDNSSAQASGRSAGGGQGGIRIGFSPLTLDFTSLQDYANGLKAVAAKAGDTVTVADPKLNVQTQVTQLQQWISLKQVDTIIVIPASPESVAALIPQAQRAGIGLIIKASPQDVGVPGPLPGVSFDVTDNGKYGAAIGDLLKQCIDSRLGGAAGQVVYLKDPRGQTSDVRTDKAVQATVATAHGHIVQTLAPPSQIEAQRSVASALQRSPGANAVVATNDYNSLGAAAAFQAAGKNPAKACIVGGASGADALAAIKAGTVYGGVAFDYSKNIDDLVPALERMAANPKANGVRTSMPLKVYTGATL